MLLIQVLSQNPFLNGCIVSMKFKKFKGLTTSHAQLAILYHILFIWMVTRNYTDTVKFLGT